ncbi:undecaprenyl pyrophosphate phosphatase [Clostridium acetireducens DSM 10703]|uniref:Undecaprenyl pyrophosphate phosphatase n=1 Tax=Clostridium acetireducens DSM 10703 TaxID=1121290 RepID=A0A1E8F1G0_9CLOT|nr:undecaprenyl pyrophosphate phosphatase [Clostridium acetireducens DSM 10703]
MNNLKYLKLHKSKIYNLIKYMDKSYLLFLNLTFLTVAIYSLFSKTLIDEKLYCFLLVLACTTCYSEIRKDVNWIPFLILAIPFIFFVLYASIYGYDFWGKILSWQLSKDIVINLNPIFKKIPLNDAYFARLYKTDTLTWFFRLVYNNGFVLPVLIPIYRAAMAKDFKKMLKYALSGHLLQIFLISPFYLTFHLQEVWYVLGNPDGLARNLSPQAAAGVTLNCFPSMHTSIAFAMFLLVLREKNKIFKYTWSFFCISVILSTMYLQIHWVLDVIAGIILAYVTVKLVDLILDILKLNLYSILDIFYYNKSFNLSNKNYLDITNHMNY